MNLPRRTPFALTPTTSLKTIERKSPFRVRRFSELATINEGTVMSHSRWSSFLSQLSKPFSSPTRNARRKKTLRVGRGLRLEPLEDRSLLAVSFEPAAIFSVGDYPTNHAIGDLSGDGKADLVTANFLGSNVSLLKGNGNGTFQPAVHTAVGANPQFVAIGDFNNDNKLDLATANTANSQNPGDVSVLLGNGDGTFQLTGIYITAMTPTSIAVADLNGDGKADLAVGNQGDENGFVSNVSILLGNGNGTFQSAVNYGSGGSPGALTLGDFNGDNKLDIATANGSANFAGSIHTVGILLNNGDGTFQTHVIQGVANPRSIVVSDFNEDGKRDLAVSSGSDSTVSILMGNGDGSFLVTTLDPTGTSGTHSLVIADFDGDDHSDLAIVRMADSLANILTGNGDGTFQPPTPTNFGVATQFSIAVGDLNGDGKPDLSVTDYTNNQVGVLINNSDSPVLPPPVLPPPVLPPPVLTPQQQVVLIKDQISALVTSDMLSAKNAKPLLTKLIKAETKLQKGKESASVNKLNALMKQVNAFKKSGKLTAADAAALNQAVEELIASI
jgi:hypothetical protein